MKKTTFIIIALSIFNHIQSQINIPNSNFKNKLLSASTANIIAKDVNGNSMVIDINNDNEIQTSEALNVYELRINNSTITDLTGIEYFTNLIILKCYSNNLTTLDLTTLTNITELECFDNQLTSLDISNQANINYLNCGNNQINNINFGSLSNLTSLGCFNNQLTNLNLENQTNLDFLAISNNQFSSIDLSNQSNLTILNCSNNQFTNLNLSNLINLVELTCPDNQLNTLNLINLTNLEKLNCNNNQLTSLDVSNQNLTWFKCFDNLLINIDVSNHTNLQYFECNDNPNLTYINLKNGNNENLVLNSNGFGYSNFENLPNLQSVCVDALNTNLTNFIISETGHSVNYSTDCSTLTLKENQLLDFYIYPIPTENILNINTNNEILEIKIYSKLGQLVIENTTKSEIDISNLTKGMYFVKIKSVNGNFGVKKIVKK